MLPFQLFFFDRFRERINESYSQLFSTADSGMDSTAEGAFAEQYGWYSSIYAIAQGDLTKFDQVTKLNIHSCFTFLSFEKQKLEIEGKRIKNAR